MSPRARTSRTASSSRLTLGLRWARFWTSWRLSRIPKQQAKAERRLTLLLEATDQQHLHLKELEERHLLLTQQFQEQRESRVYRRTGLLPPAETPTFPMLEESSTPQS